MPLSTIRRNKFPLNQRRYLRLYLRRHLRPACSPVANLRTPTRSWLRVACCLLPVALSAGCATPKSDSAPDPAARMIAEIDASPPDKRPPSWELTKARMARRPPAFGELAPDFTLPLLDGDTITRSQCHKDKPLVLIFGSFT